jgi:hypothetical protein
MIAGFKTISSLLLKEDSPEYRILKFASNDLMSCSSYFFCYGPIEPVLRQISPSLSNLTKFSLRKFLFSYERPLLSVGNNSLAREKAAKAS